MIEHCSWGDLLLSVRMEIFGILGFCPGEGRGGIYHEWIGR